MLERYIEDVSIPKRAKRGANDISASLHLVRALGAKQIDHINDATLDAYLFDRRKVASASTVNKELNLLSAACRYAVDRLKLTLVNPVRSVHRQRDTVSRYRYLLPNEVAALIKAAEDAPKADYLADVIRITVNTGLRRQEVLGASLRDVDLTANVWRVMPALDKTKNGRMVPLNEDAVNAIRRLIGRRNRLAPGSAYLLPNPATGKPIRDIKGAFIAARDRAGITDFQFRDLRHTFASWLAQKGVAIAVISEILGHADIQTTMIYAHLSPNSKAAAVGLITEGFRTEQPLRITRRSGKNG